MYEMLVRVTEVVSVTVLVTVAAAVQAPGSLPASTEADPAALEETELIGPVQVEVRVRVEVVKTTSSESSEVQVLEVIGPWNSDFKDVTVPL